MVVKLPHFKSIEELIAFFPDEQSCHDHFLSVRWPERIICPHCEHSEKIYKYSNGKRFKCASCRKLFSLKVGTIFEKSTIPLRTWFMAIYYLTSHRKGFSSHQLARDIGVTQKTAWFMLHRIRHVLDQSKDAAPLSNVVEVDETYVGGKSRKLQREKRKRGRGSQNKVAVLGMVERDGAVRAFPVLKTDRATLHSEIKQNVEPGTIVVTDDLSAYHGLGVYDFIHERVNHTRGEYAREHFHTNTIEGFWGLMKRGIIGVYHYVSAKHLRAYCDEFTFRYTTRLDSTFIRFNRTLASTERRLTYKALKGKADIFNKRKKNPPFGQGLIDRPYLKKFEDDE